MNKNEIGTILCKAADAIKTYGLLKHSRHPFYGESGGCCALGAIEVALNGHNRWPDNKEDRSAERVPAVCRALAEAIEGPATDKNWALVTIADWNNAEERTQEEVVAKFQEAAQLQGVKCE
jgi:hypothetical protein